MTNNPSLFQAKMKLYAELVKAGRENLTDADIDLIFRLSRDPEVQAFFNTMAYTYDRPVGNPA